MKTHRLLVLSDIHYSSPGERERGHPENTVIRNPLLRISARMFRHFIWLRDPHAHNSLLDAFLKEAGEPDVVAALGDYSVDSAFVGVSDDAACASARGCLEKLRERFGSRFFAVPGDHELGKMSLFGGAGGPRLASVERMERELDIPLFWQRDLDAHRLLGVTSTLVALPMFEPEILPEELPAWQALRETHLRHIREAFDTLEPGRRIILFCHDPTALPFLWQEEAIRRRAAHIDLTMIGHLHSNLIFWKSGILAGMPSIRFLGNSIRRMSGALNRAGDWRPFKPVLCPALAGIEILKDGGYYELELDPSAQTGPRLRWRPLKR
jgi:predicted MPP superfamily phosphohydrolase